VAGPTEKTSYRLPKITLARLEALAKHQSSDRPNTTSALIRAVEDAHRAAGLPEPEVPDEPDHAEGGS